jgi:site-specific recombinase XerD
MKEAKRRNFECHPISTRDASLRKVTYATNCTGVFDLPTNNPGLRDLLSSAISDATRRAYRSDLQHFQDYGGEVPTTPEAVAAYIASMASEYAPATIVRHIASLSKAHKAIGAKNPTQSELVRQALRGMKRLRGTAQRQAKPLLKEDLFAVLERMGDRPKDIRDRALLLVGFAGGFRRSELVGINFEDIEWVRQGVIIKLRRSKTDQEGAGRWIGIPFGRTRWCPVKATETWLQTAEIGDGAIFRVLDRHSRVQGKRLSGEAVSFILKSRLRQAGIDPERYSGHSLRAGFATSAATAGVSTLKIRQQTGHTTDAMLARYIRESDLFTNNAAGAVL